MLTVKQVAEQLGCQPAAVYRLIDSGQLRAVRVTPRMLRIEDVDLAAFIERQETAPADEQGGG